MLQNMESKSPDKYKTIFWVIFLVLTLISLIVGIYCQIYSEPANCPDNHNCTNSETQMPIWTIVLLIIPCIIQLFVAYHVRKGKDEKEETFMLVFFLLTFFSVTSYSIPWWLYNLGVNKEFISYFCLLIIFILVTILLRLTSLFFHQENTWFKDYTEGLRQLHFLAIMHFFAIFLSIAFICGFALAFHDRALNGHALYMEKLEFDELEDKRQEPEDFSNVICFYFEAPTTNSAGADIVFREQPPSPQNAGKPENAIEMRQHKNWQSRKEIIDYINGIFNKDKSKVPFITLFGKADPNIPVKNPYGNNLGLSQARINRAINELSGELSRNNYALTGAIKWDDTPLSNDDNYTLFNTAEERDARCPWVGEPNSNKRVVEIKVKFIVDLISRENAKPKTEPLKVLDYMYFSIYTITTTGYGDIKPVTSLAKFICSIENIIEVFFLVIFVNILISFKETRTINKSEDIESKLKDIESKLERNQ